MVETLTVENFKSIKHIKLNCRRINVFIGGPNTGKSNILEVIGLLSSLCYDAEKIRSFIRFEELSNLFYDEIVDKGFKLILDDLSVKGEWRESGLTLHVTTPKDYSYAYLRKSSPKKKDKGKLYWQWQWPLKIDIKKFKFYRFIPKTEFPDKTTEFILPPHGDNLVNILAHSKELREIANSIIGKFGFKLAIRPREGKLEIQRELEEGVIIGFPYSLISDTLQRIIFYSAVVCSNRDSVIAIEEPEAHAFPYYTKYLAELIAFDKNNNQYFITTHNPYFLLSLIEKTPKNEIAVHITYYKDYQTKVKLLNDAELREILDQGIDVFFNIERFLED